MFTKTGINPVEQIGHEVWVAELDRVFRYLRIPYCRFMTSLRLGQVCLISLIGELNRLIEPE